MTRFAFPRLRRFLADEDGSSVVPAALWIPAFMVLLASGVELGAYSARNTALESALDRTVRDVRLGKPGLDSHDALKVAICDRAAILPACEETLLLEMIRLDLRDWVAPPTAVACHDAAQEVSPVVRFEHGRNNEMMLLRACYVVEPLSPTTGLGARIATNAAGQMALVAQAAFVHEPG